MKSKNLARPPFRPADGPRLGGGQMGCECKTHSGMRFMSEMYVYKWKNHFPEMKGDVGMSLHEKEGEQKDA